MHNISVRAVLLASLAVFGVDIVTGFILINLFGGPALGSGLSDEQVRAALQVLFQDARYLTFALICGTASTVLGGYLAARLGRAVPYFNALAFGVIALTVSTLTSGDPPIWFKILGYGFTLPAALLGGHIAKLRMQTGRS
ncbi:MAG: hypothetical protein ABW171_15445 [Steroidobacter sp.]